MHSWWRHQMKPFSALWPFVPVKSPHKGQCRGSLMLPLICAWTNGWANNREAGDLRRYGAYYEVIVMLNEDVSIHYIAFVMKTTTDVVVMDHTPGTHATPAILWVLCRILPLRWMRCHIPCYMNGQIEIKNIFIAILAMILALSNHLWHYIFISMAWMNPILTMMKLKCFHRTKSLLLYDNGHKRSIYQPLSFKLVHNIFINGSLHYFMSLSGSDSGSKSHVTCISIE